MTVNSHISLWLIVARFFNVHPKSLATAERHASEGLPYFYHKLPQLGKAVDSSLDSGRFDIASVPFCKKKGTKLPLFLSELFMLVYDSEGYVLQQADPTIIRQLRQLTMLFYKFEEEPSANQIALANQQFIDRDALVGFNNLSGHYPSSFDEVRKNFMSLLPDDPKDIRIQHSSGATADQIVQSDKVHVSHVTPAMEFYGIDSVYLDYDHAFACRNSDSTISTLPPARVVQVPKDARGPRTICCEPHTNMKYQLGTMEKIYEFVENRSPAKGYVNFTDQETNRFLARRGSIDRSYTTIDLKDASDMVSWDLIQRLVSDEWRDALIASRSTIALVDGIEVTFQKFAPMGSALCFPIEAILFWSIAKTASSEVWVYGDDIIVDRESAHAVIEALESYSLVVNRDKTLHNGFFRESCGGDYYRGEPISYIKCKSYELDRFLAFANLISPRYGFNLADSLVEWYEKHFQTAIFREPLSRAANPEAYVYYTVDNKCSNKSFKTRWNKDLQCHEVRRLRETTSVGTRASQTVRDLDIFIEENPGDLAARIARVRASAIDERNLLIHWYQSVSSVSPLQNEANIMLQRILGYYVTLRPPSFEPDERLSGHADSKPRTNFGWGVHNPVSTER